MPSERKGTRWRSKGDELGRPAPVSDERLLLAIGRARDHGVPGDERRVHRARIAEHLGFAHSPATTKLLRPPLEAMESEGLIEADRRRGADYWRLTPKGSRRVTSLRKSNRSESLPESPQHREWRRAKEVAETHLPEIMEILQAELERGLELRNSSFHRFAGGEVSLGDLRRLGSRLSNHFSLFATGLYCLFEWPEPSDAKRDPNGNQRYRDLEPGSLQRGPRDERRPLRRASRPSRRPNQRRREMSADQKSPSRPGPAPAGGSPKAADSAPVAAKRSATARPKPRSKAKRAKGAQAKLARAAKGKGGRSRAGGETRKSGTERLRPGCLDRIVIADLKKREAEWPLTASAVGKSVGRSSGAVANCLERLVRDKKARLAKPKPRSYDLKGL